MKNNYREIIEGWLYLFAYDSYEAGIATTLSSKENDTPQDDVLADLQEALEDLLKNGQYEITQHLPMGIEGYPELCIALNPDIQIAERDKCFFEKAYYDLFHANENFGYQLLSIINPETGKLKDNFQINTND